VSPFPIELTTPPVTNRCFAMILYFLFLALDRKTQF
jgi:hypothetical protein